MHHAFRETPAMSVNQRLNMVNNLNPELSKKQRLVWRVRKSVGDTSRKTKNGRLNIPPLILRFFFT